MLDLINKILIKKQSLSISSETINKLWHLLIFDLLYELVREGWF